MFSLNIITFLVGILCILFVDECSCPPFPTNGLISGCNITDIVGDTVEYSCGSGYHLVGADTRTCQTGGNWTGSAPTCVVGKY